MISPVLMVPWAKAWQMSYWLFILLSGLAEDFAVCGKRLFAITSWFQASALQQTSVKAAVSIRSQAVWLEDILPSLVAPSSLGSSLLPRELLVECWNHFLIKNPGFFGKPVMCPLACICVSFVSIHFKRGESCWKRPSTSAYREATVPQTVLD